ncbi:hypothetical protein [Lentzea sp. NEAU-D7]|uniref:hypothetical protein n=1 Tax=Lentzea sp. NEAU-D7 TaxID=2994667 RepID=UPI00224B5567|nr:hypothetical protein [Lentzea sp. NEAU-D7]MCX2954558.1 hypothetical protein [Lentzea sp. NEAU-D7]
MVSALAATGLPAGATDGGPVLNCAIRATTAAGPDIGAECFPHFDQAVAFASGGTVNASAYRNDPRSAILDNTITRSINNSRAGRKILSIEFERPDWRGHSLVVYGDAACKPGEERIVRDLRLTPNSWWNDRINSFAPYNNCYDTHFRDIGRGQENPKNVLGGVAVAADLAAPHRNLTSGLSLHGGMPDSTAAQVCGKGAPGVRCTFKQEGELEYIPRHWKDVMMGWNCSPLPQQVNFSDSITRSSTYSFGQTLSVTVGSGSILPVNLESALSIAFGQEFATTQQQTYDATHELKPGSLGILRSAIAEQQLTGMWTLNYDKLDKSSWYNKQWTKSMVAHRPIDEGAVNFLFDQRPMTAAERTSNCPFSPTGSKSLS